MEEFLYFRNVFYSIKRVKIENFSYPFYYHIFVFVFLSNLWGRGDWVKLKNSYFLAVTCQPASPQNEIQGIRVLNNIKFHIYKRSARIFVQKKHKKGRWICCLCGNSVLFSNEERNFSYYLHTFRGWVQLYILQANMEALLKALTFCE